MKQTFIDKKVEDNYSFYKKTIKNKEYIMSVENMKESFKLFKEYGGQPIKNYDNTVRESLESFRSKATVFIQNIIKTYPDVKDITHNSRSIHNATRKIIDGVTYKSVFKEYFWYQLTLNDKKYENKFIVLLIAFEQNGIKLKIGKHDDNIRRNKLKIDNFYNNLVKFLEKTIETEEIINNFKYEKEEAKNGFWYTNLNYWKVKDFIDLLKKLVPVYKEVLKHYNFPVSSKNTTDDETIGKNILEIKSATNKSNETFSSLHSNTILYGPPGTGKTYSTRKKAVKIIDNTVNEDLKERYNELYNNEQIKFITFHQSYSYEQFVEGITVRTENGKAIYEIKDGIFKKMCEKAKNDSENNYVLIIDEINRGNISKIFGELITLIEPDKRLGADNEIIVELPYSNEKFGVPPNLYIIGTMNTADRSLVQLDTALRRRFAFEEMMPKYNDEINWNNNGLLSDYKLSDFLKKLNEKITKYKDREHQIGHSYLMNVKDEDALKFAWCNQIMPLLQEYFYNDLESLHEIIGESEFLKKTGSNGEERYDLKLDVKNFDEEFKKVYKHIISKDSDKNEGKDSSE